MQKTLLSSLAVALIAACAPPLTAGTLTVNEGSAEDGYIPFHFYYLDNANCRSQVVFPAEQLSDMSGSAIREIQFYINDDGYASSWHADEMIVSLAEIDENGFATDANRYATFFDPEWHVAYSGPMDGEGGARTLTFKLSKPFNYNGSNLLLQVSLGSAGNAYPSTKFLGVTTENFPSAYTTSGSTTYAEGFLPKATFTYGEIPAYEASVAPSDIDFGTTLLSKESTSTIKVTNMGTNALVPVVGAPSNSAFSISDIPTSIESGKNAELTVTFKSTAAGEYTSSVKIDLGEAGSFDIALKASAMDMPSGYNVDFNLPAKTLPTNWDGWFVSKEYDFNIGDYNEITDQKETLNYFEAYTKDNTNGVTVEEGNHIREYPNMHFIYMISPMVKGNVLLQVAATSANDYALNIYKTAKDASGNWTIGEAVPYAWATMPNNGWGIAILQLDKEANLAIDLYKMAISSFAADELGGTALKDYSAVLSSESLDFGIVNIGETATKTLTITNNGKNSFDIALTPAVDAPYSAKSNTTTLGAGLSAEIAVTFAPTEADAFPATLSPDLGNAGTFTVALDGEGVEKSTDVPVGTTFTADGAAFEVTAPGEVSLTEAPLDTKEYAVPANVKDENGVAFKITSIGREAFYWSSITKVTLPEGIESIGYGAFRQSDLAEINLPSTIKTIEDYAFRTTALTSIAIPEGVTRLGASVFGMCEQLAEITLPSTLTSLGNGVFYKTAITSMVLPQSCTDIDAEAFEACPNLSKVVLPEGLEKIKTMTFIDCPMLKTIELPESLKTIETRAFENSGLIALHIPAGVEAIASNSFTNAPIGEITVAAANSAFKTVTGVLYSADGNFLYLYPRNDSETYTVADGTRGIIGGAFYRASIKTVSLPESLIGIDEMAFCNSNLESIDIPAGVSVLFAQAFAGTKLRELTLPASVTKMEEALVAGCTELTTVTLPAGLTDVAIRAFNGCTALESIICKGETPSEFDGWEALTDPFRGVDKSKVTIYCPDASVAEYKASEWGDFFENIKGISEYSGIEGIANGTIEIHGGSTITVNAPSAVAVKVFDTAGRMVFSTIADGTIAIDGLAHGLYIVKAGEKTAKVTVK